MAISIARELLCLDHVAVLEVCIYYNLLNLFNLSGKSKPPKVGKVVVVRSLGKNGTVLRADPFKEEVLVQAGNMKLKLELSDIET